MNYGVNIKLLWEIYKYYKDQILYVKQLYVNDKNYDKSYLAHETIQNGAKLLTNIEQ